MVKNGSSDPIYGKKRQWEIVRFPFLDMVPFHCHFFTIIRLPIFKQPVLIYPLLLIFATILLENLTYSNYPGKQATFFMIKDVADK